MTVSTRIALLAGVLLATAACGARDNREVPIGKAGEAELSISATETIEGTGLLRATIAPRSSDRSLGSGSLNYSTDRVRNIIIINAASGANRQLLPDNGRTIVDALWLPDQAGFANVIRRADAFDAPVANYVLSVRQAGESRLIDVMVGAVAEGQAKPVVTDAQELYSATALGEGRVALLLAKGGRAMHVLVDMPNATILSETPVIIQ